MPARAVIPASTRRSFLKTAALGACVMPALGHSAASGSNGAILRGTCAHDENRVRFTSPALEQSCSITLIADTHLFRDDERGAPYRPYSGRMAKAYNTTKHFKTGAAMTPEEGFKGVLQSASEAKSDLVAMLGDIVSFPSEAGVEWVCATVADAGLPTLYVAGNHDWHYEGLSGSSASLRATWIEKRLLPLYNGKNPLMAVYEVKGVRLVVIDNSTYEVDSEQLAFFRQQAAANVPLVLLLHIPLYAPGRSMGFGCGHPEWGAANDRGYQIEKRPRWPESGHSAVTREFHRAVFACPSLLGIFAGHTHRASTDIVNGIPQFVVEPNFKGGSMTVNFAPQSA